ncbi:PAS domain S-box protein [Candidatus Latescibacterota bacterium]
MATPLSVLVVEDSEDDVLLLVRELKRGGFDVSYEHVDNPDSLCFALEEKTWDIVISDFSMPGFDGLDSWSMVKKCGNDIPFIILSGAIGEDVAVEAMKAGVHDYIMKDNLSRLVPAIKRELREVEIRRAQKKAENSLLESQESYRLLAQNLPVGIFRNTIDPEGKLIMANIAMAKIFGYDTVDDLLKISIKDLFFKKSDSKIYFKKILDQGQFSGEEILLKKCDGTQIWGEVTARVINDESGNPLHIDGALEDISQRKQMEIERDRIFNLSIDMLCVTGFDGYFKQLNPAWSKILGWSKEEFLSKRCFDFVHADDIQKTSEAHEKLFKGISLIGFENRFICKDGAYRWISWNVIPLLDENLMFGVGRDITDQKESEKKNKMLEEQLQQSQKMESIGLLAGGIAHDFNNILAAITGFSELALESDIPEGHMARESLNEILKSSLRATDLVKQILAFSRKSDIQKRPFNVSTIIIDIVKMLKATFPSTIEIKLNITATKDLILAGPSHIEQIVINLCTNAAHAMGDKGGTLTIGLEDMVIDNNSKNNYQEIQSGNYLRLTIQDTGNGMETEILNRIFEPYYSTKSQSEGTGLGLAVVHGIVRILDGSISVCSQVGTGSAFEIILPKHTEPETSETDTNAFLSNGTETILFVDDEEQIVTYNSVLLSKRGYEVIGKTDSIDAFETFQMEPDSFDLVITDQTMPQITGTELAQMMLDIRPNTKVILCTGYSKDVTLAKVQKQGIQELLFKPIKIQDMELAIRRVLDGKTSERE